MCWKDECIIADLRKELAATTAALRCAQTNIKKLQEQIHTDDPAPDQKIFDEEPSETLLTFPHPH